MNAAPESNAAPMSGYGDEPSPPAPTTAPSATVEHSPIRLAEDQADALATDISHAFPPWMIWRANNIWYATGPCPTLNCVCSRTLHAPTPSGLCRQLDESERAAQNRQEVSR